MPNNIYRKKKINVYSEDHTKPLSILVGKNASMLASSQHNLHDLYLLLCVQY